MEMMKQFKVYVMQKEAIVAVSVSAARLVLELESKDLVFEDDKGENVAFFPEGSYLYVVS